TAALATTSLVQQAFAQTDTTTQDKDDKKDRHDKKDTTTQGGVKDDDDTKQASSTPTKVKNTTPCNVGGFRNTCEQESEAELDASVEED
ncbi:MAG TPA: hypothetical protein VIP70_06730, partial [Nitrososphaeraceae archaeon]